MSDRRPHATWLIGLVLVAMHVRLAIAAGHFHALGFVPPDILVAHGASTGAPVRFATSILLHATLWQLAYTIAALAVIGPRVERSHGRGATLLYFVIAGAVAAFLARGLGSDDPVVGASGALFGLCAVQAIDARHRAEMVKLAVLMLLLGFMVGADSRSHLGGLLVGAALGWIPRMRRADHALFAIGLVLLAAIALADACPCIP